jgi:hypothetical protein
MERTSKSLLERPRSLKGLACEIERRTYPCETVRNPAPTPATSTLAPSTASQSHRFCGAKNAPFCANLRLQSVKTRSDLQAAVALLPVRGREGKRFSPRHGSRTLCRD